MSISKRRAKGQLKPVEINCLDDLEIFDYIKNSLCCDCLVKLKCFEEHKGIPHAFILSDNTCVNKNCNFLFFMRPCRRLGHALKAINEEGFVKVFKERSAYINNYRIERRWHAKTPS